MQEALNTNIANKGLFLIWKHRTIQVWPSLKEVFQSLVITRLPFNQTYTLQGSKLNFLKSRLLATFSCKMVAIEIIWSPKSSHQWEDISYCVTGVFTVVNSTKHRWILRFFFQICWSLIGDFRRIFSRQIYLLLLMATKTVATWSAARIAFPKTVQYNKMSKLSC